MGSKSHTTITGLVLLGLALVWSVLVVQTIPAGLGDGDVGPRAFPLLLGIILAVLSAVMVVKSLLNTDQIDEPDSPLRGGKLEVKIVLSVFMIIMSYGFLFEKIGFLLATLVVVAAMLLLILKSRKPMLIASMAIGLAVGCWLVFGKLVGAYLPHGSWISLG
jgi:putative tricarboxylic transport membrane protein